MQNVYNLNIGAGEIKKITAPISAKRIGIKIELVKPFILLTNQNLYVNFFFKNNASATEIFEFCNYDNISGTYYIPNKVFEIQGENCHQGEIYIHNLPFSSMGIIVSIIETLKD